MKNIKGLLIAFVLVFVVGTMSVCGQENRIQTHNEQVKKMEQLMWMVDFQYVDTIDFVNLTEKGIVEMLKQLDPHSVYIPKKDFNMMNEKLVGNFEGVGIAYQIFKDTLTVVQTIKGGPSELVGVLPGDKIVTINDSAATGKICTNEWVYKKLRGPKGSKVLLGIKRGNEDKLFYFTIIRDKIPINSIESYFMVDNKTGYIRLDGFTQTSHKELVNAMTLLQKQGMENLIFDLRGNSGGYLNIAIDIADEFIRDNDKVIVYTKNNQNGEQVQYTTGRHGLMENGKLVVLIDEYSASASEIVSGAIQDWDRGVIIGRRSFGKGLVQSQITLRDGSAVRLTTSKYYIPSGRCIQKPYEGIEDYSLDAIKRYNAGELTHADSIHFPDSLKFHTANNRVVYGGGGIMPDIFVPIDTTIASDFYLKLYRNNIFNQFVFTWLDKNKNTLQQKYADFDDFYKNFNVGKDILDEFYAYAEKEGITPSNTMDFDVNIYLKNFLDTQKDSLKAKYPTYESLTQGTDFQNAFNAYIAEQIRLHKQRQSGFDTEAYIKRQIKTLIARHVYSSNEATKIWMEADSTYQKAIEIISSDTYFKKHKIK